MFSQEIKITNSDSDRWGGEGREREQENIENKSNCGNKYENSFATK